MFTVKMKTKQGEIFSSGRFQDHWDAVVFSRKFEGKRHVSKVWVEKA